MDLHNIREEYRKRVLAQHDCHENPIKQFELWLNEAITGQVNEPTAVNVATVVKRSKRTRFRIFHQLSRSQRTRYRM